MLFKFWTVKIKRFMQAWFLRLYFLPFYFTIFPALFRRVIVCISSVFPRFCPEFYQACVNNRISTDNNSWTVNCYTKNIKTQAKNEFSLIILQNISTHFFSLFAINFIQKLLYDPSVSLFLRINSNVFYPCARDYSRVPAQIFNLI